MNLLRRFQDPVTRKRLRRLRENRRAWWSLGILVALYALSLIAELLCNDRPLYVRYAGHRFFRPSGSTRRIRSPATAPERGRTTAS